MYVCYVLFNKYSNTSPVSCCFISASEVYYWCLDAINCTGKNMSDDLLWALGVADANKYLCSKDIRPSEQQFFLDFIPFSHLDHCNIYALLSITALDVCQLLALLA